jgi:hypothetical protein
MDMGMGMGMEMDEDEDAVQFDEIMGMEWTDGNFVDSMNWELISNGEEGVEMVDQEDVTDCD